MPVANPDTRYALERARVRIIAHGGRQGAAERQTQNLAVSRLLPRGCRSRQGQAHGLPAMPHRSGEKTGPAAVLGREKASLVEPGKRRCRFDSEVKGRRGIRREEDWREEDWHTTFQKAKINYGNGRFLI